MPAFVVRALAEWLSGRGGQVVAGTASPALDRAVEGVARVRRLIDREIDALNVHDSVLFALDTLSANPDSTLDALVTALGDAQAGLIVTGLPPREEATDQRPYAAADAQRLALISLPAGTDLSELAREIDDHIRARQSAAARYVRDALSALGRARHSDDPLQSLATALANHTGLVFALEDENRVMVLRVAPDNPPCDDEQVRAALASYAARQAVRPATPGGMGEDIPIQRHLPGGLARAIVPLQAGTATIAYLSLIGPESRLGPADVDLLWRAAPLVAFEMGKIRKEQNEQRRTAADDLDALLAGATPEHELSRRANERGHDLTQPYAVVVALPPSLNPDPSTWASERLERLSRQTTYWASVASGSVRFVVPQIDLSEESLDRVVKLFGGESGKVIMGVGRAGIGISALRQSLREAERSAQTALRYPGHGVTHYADLGVMRLLFPLQETGALEEFCRETLTPLIQADSLHHNDALLSTLEVWFAANGNLTEAARRLSLHRNTLMYRLNRIQDLLGSSLDDPELRLSLQLALKIWHMRQV